jgi:hypothetical protein
MEEKITITRKGNGFLALVTYFNEDKGEYDNKELVFQERQPKNINERFSIPKEKVECFKDLVYLMEEIYG